MTRELLLDQREKLLGQLVDRANWWDEKYQRETKTEDPDPDRLASLNSMSNAYLTLCPYAKSNLHSPTRFEHTNQSRAEEDVKKRNLVSQLPDRDLQELLEYRDFAIYSHFAASAASLRRPITYSEITNKIIGAYKAILPTVS